ncbi:MAG: CAP domain-containing protein [Aquamicrobium sp.]|uniref:CAP domain-containing protein n=1 Tax=Aquamicrobium sp. TaxID=1872579 RepID=UPI00349E795A|nr:CAP domain-containing protein [Aquamicrobium sp.]
MTASVLTAALRATALSALLVLAACQTGDWWPREDSSAGASVAAASHVRDIRAAAGLTGLSPDAKLEKAAQRQAAYMAGSGRMEHTTGPGRDFAARMKRDGVAAPAAENLAHGRMELERLFSMWMASPGHRRNMLDPRFSRYGLAHAAAGDGQRYWALVLGP